MTWALDKEKELDRLKCVLECEDSRYRERRRMRECRQVLGIQSIWGTVIVKYTNSGRPEANMAVRPCGKMTREVF